MIGLYSTTRVGSMPHDAATTTLGRASSMRTASSCGGEAAEHHRVHGADPRAGEHRDDRLGDHRHVDHHPVALLDPEAAQGAGERGHLLEQLRRR